MAEYPNGQAIWNFLVAKLGNEFGAAGMMGNLYWESELIPYRKENDYSAGYTVSLEYTNGVNNGTISRDTFTYDEVGYGLAQWTYYSRKRELYDWKQERGVSIGDLRLGLDYLWWELNNLTEFRIVLTTLQTAQTIREASDIVFTRFENPKYQTEENRQIRENTSTDIYNTYHGGVPPHPSQPTKSMPLWMMTNRRKIYVR